jgi:hypothetical protein
MKYIINLALCVAVFFPAYALADFSKVTVKMQSGLFIPLVDLPWFKFAKNLQDSPYRDKATTAEWVIHAPPAFCPYEYRWYVRWSGSIEQDKASNRDSCTRSTHEKLKHLPADVQAVCQCSLILQTDVSDVVGQRSTWKSFNDELLLSDEIKIQRTLKWKDESLPVLISLGGLSSGLYNYSGEKLCTYVGREVGGVSGKAALEKFLNTRSVPVPVACFNRWQGVIDMSGTYFNFFTRKFSGDVQLNFDNGERYVITE